MNDAWALDAANAGEIPLTVVKQGVDEGAIGIAGGGMHDHARCLVEDQQVGVFKEDIERNVLGGSGQWHGLGQSDGDEVAEFYRIAWFGRLAVDVDELVANERLNA